MEPIRILHMIGSLEIGGSQAMVLNWYRAIDRKIIQFDFVVDHPERMALASEIEKLGGKIFLMPTFIGKNYREVKNAWDNLLGNHPEYRILHTHVRSYASLFLPIAHKHGLKTIAHSHSTSNGKGVKSLIKDVLQYPIRYQADYLFSCSKEAGEWLFGRKATKERFYYMIPNGIECRAFAFDKEKREKVRNSLGIGERKKVIGHVGRFHTAKNHTFLIDIFYEVYQRNENLELLLVGGGELREEIEKKCRQLGIREHVHFCGEQTNVEAFYSAMDLFVFPSLWEGLPMSVIEAQASGLRCILSDSITKDVCLTELVNYLPLSSNVAEWAEYIIRCIGKNREAISEVEYIKLKDFDVSCTAKWIERFYLNL